MRDVYRLINIRPIHIYVLVPTRNKYIRKHSCCVKCNVKISSVNNAWRALDVWSLRKFLSFSACLKFISEQSVSLSDNPLSPDLVRFNCIAYMQQAHTVHSPRKEDYPRLYYRLIIVGEFVKKRNAAFLIPCVEISTYLLTNLVGAFCQQQFALFFLSLSSLTCWF